MTARISARLIGAGAVAFLGFIAISTVPAAAQARLYSQTDPSAAVYRFTPDADQQSSPALRRQVVSYPSNEPAGTIIVDPAHTFLYLTLGNGMAMRYGIGVGRQGFEWSGTERIVRKAEWPDWTPPPAMVARQPYLPRWIGGGPGNPLGARALYLGNTDYRIHGTNEPDSIGKHMSSGCIRLLNADITDLYSRVAVGSKVVVLTDTRSRRISAAQTDINLPAAQTVPQGWQPQLSRSASRNGDSLTGIY
ncbi:MAG: L,D-transpeptidase [Xanthobacteraceae bacterium]